ncbi:DUF6230 family protein [Streptomyces sp. NPDC047061]|uniref:DUF6230 family protein n=1 Tax=unclassified Streptomyces TaxID=2593676 RepID=UPI0033ED9596
MESQVRGGTRWKRFAVVMVPSVAATACIGVALAQGALAASFSVSGQQFKVTADQLEGDGFVQYGAVDSGYTLAGKSTIHPVAVSAFNTAKINNLCQSVVTPNVPIFGNVSLILHAGTDASKPVEASKLYIDLDDLSADATFTNINIGVAASSSTKGPGVKSSEVSNQQTNPYGFAQEADHASLSGVKQTAWATTAGTFKLSGLHMSISTSGAECY